MSDLADLRKDYSLAGLSEKDLTRDPFRQFDRWYQEAGATRPSPPPPRSGWGVDLRTAVALNNLRVQ